MSDVEPRDGRLALPSEADEIDNVISQARWLMDYHSKRSDGLSSRSVAVLGLVGVVLALLSRGFDVATKLSPTPLLWGTLGVTVAVLVAAAVFAISAIATRKVDAPGLDQARLTWAGYLGDKANRGHVGVDVAESLLVGTDLTKECPVSLAKREADSRARWFKRSLIAIAVSFVGLALLIIQTYTQIGGHQ